MLRDFYSMTHVSLLTYAIKSNVIFIFITDTFE